MWSISARHSLNPGDDYPDFVVPWRKRSSREKWNEV